MTQLSLKTKFDYDLEETKERFFKYSYDYKNKAYNLLPLKNGPILIYTTNNINILNNNLQQKKLISFNENEIITSIKEIQKEKLFCCVKDLYVLSIKSSKIINKEKIVIPNNEIIYDVIKLKNGKILGITNKTIIEIKENYEIDELFKIPQNWLIKSYKEQYRYYSGFQQYINLYELPNNKLLINSHSTEFSHNGGCGTNPPYQISINKIYILNLFNFEIIHQFDELKSEINIVILDKYICIIYFYKYHLHNLIDIYNIEDYKLIKKIEDRFDKQYIIKIDGNKFISMSISENKNHIILYDLSYINDIKYQIFKENFIRFKTKYYNGPSKVRNTKNKSICILKDGSIFIICHGKIYIVEFPKLFNLLPLSEFEYKKENFKHLEMIHFDDDD